MTSNEKDRRPLGLLISVRNLVEARCVNSVGVDVLDVKEPMQGALGRADEAVLSDIVQLGTHQLLSAALGELNECEEYLASHSVVTGLDLAKCGLANSAKTQWRSRVENVWRAMRESCQPVAVAYADWERCDAPSPMKVLELAIENRLEYLLVDTYVKDGTTSLELVDDSELMQLVSLAAAEDIKTVLAGSISASDLQLALRLGFNLVGVRGAVCKEERESQIARERVVELKRAIDSLHYRCASTVVDNG